MEELGTLTPSGKIRAYMKSHRGFDNAMDCMLCITILRRLTGQATAKRRKGMSVSYLTERQFCHYMMNKDLFAEILAVELEFLR